VNGKKTKRMEKELLCIKTVENLNNYGKMENKLNEDDV
jgi:hypothetical protein